MSYKIGLILSLLFVAITFLFCTDLISIQYIYSSLDAKAINISYVISRSGIIDNDFVNYISSNYDVTFISEINLYPTFGEEIDFTISKKYRPLVVSKQEMTISINRSAIVGYFG